MEGEYAKNYLVYMIKMKENFLKSMKYIDGITIIDSEGVIQYSVKYNPSFYPEDMGREDIIGKKLEDIFTNINNQDSTLFDAMNCKKVIEKKNQKIINKHEELIETMNISFPIIINGKTVGAIELSKDISNIEAVQKKIMNIDQDIFRNKVKAENRLGSNKARYTLDDIISDNQQIIDLKNQIKQLKNSIAPVFIYGETGTGKELFAHAIHNESSQCKGPFISQNCAAIPENLLESILFGTVKGSYTGAIDAPGLFELADNGTLFLDELNSMSKNLQAKMLRVLEDGYIRRVGGKKEKKINIRIISAANQDPIKLIQDGILRRDIYYRLCVLYFVLPPLRKRKNDIIILINYFVKKFNQLYNKRIVKISNELFRTLKNYEWPGNIRELEHIIQFGLTQVGEDEEVLEYKHIASKLKNFKMNNIENNVHLINRPLKDIIKEIEEKVIYEALRTSAGNVSKASKIIKIPRQTFSRKMKEYGIEK